MLVFTRQTTIRPGKLTEALSFISEIGDFVDELLDQQEIAAYVVAFGAPRGTVVWSSSFDSMDQWIQADGRLMESPDYLAMTDRSGSLFMPGRDAMHEVVHHTPDSAFGAHFVEMTTATVSPGKIPQAMQWGSETLDYAVNVTGLSGIMTHTLYGRFAQISWFASAPDAAAVDESRAKLQGDPGYLERLSRAGADELFIPGSGRTSLSRRIR